MAEQNHTEAPETPERRRDGRQFADFTSPAMQSGPQPAGRRDPYRPRATRPRKHMGVATNDPEYLPPANIQPGNPDPAIPSLHGRHAFSSRARRGESRPEVNASPAPHAAARGGAPEGDPSQLRYNRYVSTPKRGRSIFTSRYERRRRRTARLIILIAAIALALALAWFFALR